MLLVFLLALITHMFYYKLLFTLTTPRSPNPFHRNFFTEKYDNPWSREDLNTNWLREPMYKEEGTMLQKKLRNKV